jgi:uncharacterized protein YdcH (DUF465 family)
MTKHNNLDKEIKETEGEIVEFYEKNEVGVFT